VPEPPEKSKKNGTVTSYVPSSVSSQT